MSEVLIYWLCCKFEYVYYTEEKVAAQLLSLAHECEKKQEGIEDECERTLEVAKCFRRDVKQIDWVPKMEVLMTEVIEAWQTIRRNLEDFMFVDLEIVIF